MSHISSSDLSEWGVGEGVGGKGHGRGFSAAGKVLVLDLGGDLDDNTNLLSRTFSPPPQLFCMGHGSYK